MKLDLSKLCEFCIKSCVELRTRPRTPWHVGQQTSDGRNVNIKLEFCEAEFPIMS